MNFGPLFWNGFKPYLPLVHVGHLFYHCQADAVAGKFRAGMHSLEYLEELGRVVHIKANAVIVDGQVHAAIALRSANGNARLFSGAGEFEGIAKEMPQGSFEQ